MLLPYTRIFHLYPSHWIVSVCSWKKVDAKHLPQCKRGTLTPLSHNYYGVNVKLLNNMTPWQTQTFFRHSDIQTNFRHSSQRGDLCCTCKGGAWSLHFPHFLLRSLLPPSRATDRIQLWGSTRKSYCLLSIPWLSSKHFLMDDYLEQEVFCSHCNYHWSCFWFYAERIHSHWNIN